MTKTPLWRSIADTLSAEIGAGHYRPGDKLPTEAQLATRFNVNRHTVRHALQALQQAGLTQSRRGAGVFVMAQPADYPIGRRVRFHQNLQAAGRLPAKQVLTLQTRPCNGKEAEALRLTPGDPVHVYEGLSLADAVPVALFRSVFCASRFPNLLQDLEQHQSLTAALKASGLSDYTRAQTRLSARLATAAQAARRASISAWAVGSWRARVSLPAAATILPVGETTTAPTGTSPRVAAARA